MSSIADVYSLVKMATNEDPTHRFLVEWYGAQAPAHSIGETADRLSKCAASMSTRGQRVRLLTAIAVPADDYAFGVFAAESAELVAQVCREAGAPAERISSAVGWIQAPDR
jgi:hypothetical protein